MFGLAEPWWLLALLTIPLIRWLHQWRAPLSRVSVSAVFLWRGADSIEAGGDERRSPDRAWFLRALIAALAVLALAQPWQQRTLQRLTIWVDDSLSMATIESGQSRLATGLERAGAALVESESAQVTMRSMQNPALQVTSPTSNDFSAGRWPVSRTASFQLAAPGLLSEDSAHWLITDGASTEIQEWTARAPLQRIIQVGHGVNNVAITRLALRRRPAGETQSDVLVEITNRGQEVAQRSLKIRTSLGEQEVSELLLAPGETQRVSVVVGITSAEIEADLQANDELALDDTLTLDLGLIDEVRTYVDAECAPAVKTAIHAHPGLVIESDLNNAGLEVRCSEALQRSPARLRFYAGDSAPVSSSITWLPEAGDLQDIHLEPGWLFATSWPSDMPPTDAQSLLLADNKILVVHSPADNSVATILDMNRSEIVDQPEFAAVIAGLVDTALGRPILDAVAVSAFDPLDSNVAPAVLSRASMDQPRSTRDRQSIADTFLLLALILLILDILRLLLTRAKASHA